MPQTQILPIYTDRHYKLGFWSETTLLKLQSLFNDGNNFQLK